MAEPIGRLAQFVAETKWDDIPHAVQEHAKLVVLDTLGVMLAGAEQTEVRQLQTALCATGGNGATVLARGWPTADPRSAALLNGIAGRSIELCEGHHHVSCQAAVQILPGALAVGESSQSAGRELLTALIVGYDVAVRLGAAMTARSLAHQNGQTALLGAVAAGARLRGLDAAETSVALRMGATLMLTPSYTNAVAGATVLNVAGGMSSFAACLAPELALSGFTARDNAIDESLSSLVGNGFRPDGVLDELGTRWEITRNHFRLRACCNPINAALDALEDALSALSPQPEEIERIQVVTYRFAAVMSNPHPHNTFAAKYSLPHAAAARIVRGNIGYGAFMESVVHDPAISALRQRMDVVEDPAMTAKAPRSKPARVTLSLKDGRRSTHTCENARDYQEPEIRQKFRELAGLVLTSEGAARVEQIVNRCDQWQNIAVLIDELRRCGRN